MFKSKTRIICLALLLGIIQNTLNAQCEIEKPGVLWKGSESEVSLEELVHHFAPILWFSPDEEKLYNDQNEIQLPNSFPFEEHADRVVYYKLRKLFKKIHNKNIASKLNDDAFKNGILNLDNTKALKLNFYYYFAEETGLGSHAHDIESMELTLEVNKVHNCDEFKYYINTTLITGHAHGYKWFDNVLDVDEFTFLPPMIIIEEGKHGSSTDKNADGVFTPGFDVTRRIVDAWGVRDIISTGTLFTGGFEAFMAKVRKEEHIVFPPLRKESISYEKYIKKFGDYITPDKVYELRPYPAYPRTDVDHLLDHKMEEKKYHNWPKEIEVKPYTNAWLKEEGTFSSWSLAYRWDDSQALVVTAPLLIFKSVQAPMTGGWLTSRFSSGLGRSSITDSTFISEKLFGYQVVHNGSASKWIDSYIGLGFDIVDGDFSDETDYDTRFVSEVGLKIRVNIEKTPLKFLKHIIRTNYAGLRLGWKFTGFGLFDNGAFVLEFGAGAF